MRVAKWLLLTAVLFIAGCQKIQQTGGVDNPERWKGVVSLSPSTTELALGLYIEDFVTLGRTQSCNHPAKKVDAVPVVMNGVKPNFEMIAALEPDAVLYDADLFSADDLKKFEDLKIDSFGFKAKTLDEFIKELYVFGSKTGGESKVADYVDKIVASRGEAQSNAPANKVKVAVLLPGSGNEHMILGKDSFVASILNESGGDTQGPDGAMFQPLSAEALLGMNPDLIITAGDPAGFLKDTRFASLNAVKNQKVVGVDQDRLLRKGSRVDSLIPALSKLVVDASK